MKQDNIPNRTHQSSYGTNMPRELGTNDPPFYTIVLHLTSAPVCISMGREVTFLVPHALFCIWTHSQHHVGIHVPSQLWYYWKRKPAAETLYLQLKLADGLWNKLQSLIKLHKILWLLSHAMQVVFNHVILASGFDLEE